MSIATWLRETSKSGALGEIDIVDQPGQPRKLKVVATIKHSIFQGQVLMSDANFRKLFLLQRFRHRVDLGQACRQQAALACRPRCRSRRLFRERRYGGRAAQNVSKRPEHLSRNVPNPGFGLLCSGTLGLAVVLVRTVVERKSELALLASLGFSPASRVELILSENAMLLLLGLIFGSISAIIGILPAVLREGRPINIRSLAATIAIVAVVGLTSSVIAVALSGIRVQPADLRRNDFLRGHSFRVPLPRTRGRGIG